MTHATELPIWGCTAECRVDTSKRFGFLSCSLLHPTPSTVGAHQIDLPFGLRVNTSCDLGHMPPFWLICHLPYLARLFNSTYTQQQYVTRRQNTCLSGTFTAGRRRCEQPALHQTLQEGRGRGHSWETWKLKGECHGGQHI